jgi:hypothetical protein
VFHIWSLKALPDLVLGQNKLPLDLASIFYQRAGKTMYLLVFLDPTKNCNTRALPRIRGEKPPASGFRGMITNASQPWSQPVWLGEEPGRPTSRADDSFRIFTASNRPRRRRVAYWILAYAGGTSVPI